MVYSLYLEVAQTSTIANNTVLDGIADFMSSWTMLFIMKANIVFPIIMPCRFPQSNYGSCHLCCENGTRRACGLQSSISCYMPSIHKCYFNKIFADDGQLGSISYTDLTHRTYCKILGHEHFI